MPRPSKMFMRFAAVGALNTLLGLSFFPALYWLAHDVLRTTVILTISYVVCTLFAFTMHKFVTFSSTGKAHHEGAKFAGVTGILWGINVLLLNLALTYTHVHPIVAQTVIAVALQLGNYVILKRFVFCAQRDTSTANQ